MGLQNLLRVLLGNFGRDSPPHRFLRQQLEGPSSLAFGRGAARDRDDLRLLAVIKFAFTPIWPWSIVQRGIQPALHVLVPHTPNHARVCAQAVGNLLNTPTTTEQLKHLQPKPLSFRHLLPVQGSHPRSVAGLQL